VSEVTTMSRRERHATTAALLLAGALLGGMALAPSADAQRARSRPAPRAIERSSDDWSRWNDFNWTILQMQRESISSQEEQARESGRAVRRDELQQQRQEQTVEHEEYFDAILESSLAALRAPKGAYYRKPGHVSAEPPASGAQAVTVGGLPYLYDNGVFWLHQGPQYLVVTAPVGAVVDALPAAAYRIPAGEEPLWYSFGTFYREAGGKYAVVKPPAGAVVIYLPDGYTQETTGQTTLYRFGEVLFKPVFLQGTLVYQVAGH
jgi:hypothetical protein